MMLDKYYIAANGETKGPYSKTQLKSMWERGLITSDTQYWTEGMDDWYLASNLLEEQPEGDLPQIPGDDAGARHTPVAPSDPTLSAKSPLGGETAPLRDTESHDVSSEVTHVDVDQPITPPTLPELSDSNLSIRPTPTSKLKLLFLFLLSTCFTIGGIVLAQEPEQDVFGYLMALFFGSGTIIFFLQLCSPGGQAKCGIMWKIATAMFLVPVMAFCSILLPTWVIVIFALVGLVSIVRR